MSQAALGCVQLLLPTDSVAMLIKPWHRHSSCWHGGRRRGVQPGASAAGARVSRRLLLRLPDRSGLPRRPPATAACPAEPAASRRGRPLGPVVVGRCSAAVGHMSGTQLARQRPGVRSIECVYGPGRFYDLGPRRHSDRLPGLHLGGPRLILQHGALLLLVPSPCEATVPHRTLPGLPAGGVKP